MSTDSNTPQYLLPDGTVDWEIIWRSTGTVTGPNLGWLYYGHTSDQIEAIAQDELGNRQMRIILGITSTGNTLPEFHWPMYIIALADAVYRHRCPEKVPSASSFICAIALQTPLPTMPSSVDVEKILATCLRYMPPITKDTAQDGEISRENYPELAAATAESIQPQLKLLHMPRRRGRGRPPTEEATKLKRMFEAYFYHYHYPRIVYQTCRELYEGPLELVPDDQITPMRLDLMARVLNNGKRPGESDGCLTPKQWGNYLKMAQKEIQKDPNWYQNVHLQRVKELGFESIDEYNNVCESPDVIEAARVHSDKVVDIIFDDMQARSLKRKKAGKLIQ